MVDSGDDLGKCFLTNETNLVFIMLLLGSLLLFAEFFGGMRLDSNIYNSFILNGKKTGAVPSSG